MLLLFAAPNIATESTPLASDCEAKRDLIGLGIVLDSFTFLYGDHVGTGQHQGVLTHARPAPNVEDRLDPILATKLYRGIRDGRRLTILDIGANIGQGVERFAGQPWRRPGKQLRLISVEPGAPAFAQLEAKVAAVNAQAQGSVKVEAIHAAVSKVKSRASLMSSAGANQNAHLDLSKAPPADGHGNTVVIETVDTILGARGIDMLDFLKIDTEGFERLVLEGASTALRGGRIHAIQLEYGLNWFRAAQARDNGHATLHWLVEFFDGLGYDVFYGTPSGLIRLNQWSPIFELPVGLLLNTNVFAFSIACGPWPRLHALVQEFNGQGDDPRWPMIPACSNVTSASADANAKTCNGTSSWQRMRTDLYSWSSTVGMLHCETHVLHNCGHGDARALNDGSKHWASQRSWVGLQRALNEARDAAKAWLVRGSTGPCPVAQGEHVSLPAARVASTGNTAGAARRAQAEVASLTRKLAQLGAEQQETQGELDKTFFLNFGKRGELSDKIKVLQKKGKAQATALEQAIEHSKKMSASKSSGGGKAGNNSICLLQAVDDAYAIKFAPFLASQRAWAALHGINLITRTLLRHSAHPITYGKIGILLQAMQAHSQKCQWIMWLDGDIRVCNLQMSPYEWIHSDAGSNVSLIMTDHHAALNNGAFFIRNDANMLLFVKHWMSLNSKCAYPFTDNGSMLAAILELFFEDKRCECFPQGTDRFLGCVHGVLDVRLGGPPSEARHIRRITSALGTLNLVYPQRGFNNHPCATNDGHTHVDCGRTPIIGWGWSAEDTYKPGTGMFAVHTKSTLLPC